MISKFRNKRNHEENGLRNSCNDIMTINEEA